MAPMASIQHMSQQYVDIASGSSLDDMCEHIEDHMRQGLSMVIESIPDT